MQSTRNLCGFFAHLPRYPFPISEKNSSVVFTAARMSTFQLSRKGERPQFDNGGKNGLCSTQFQPTGEELSKMAICIFVILDDR